MVDDKTLKYSIGALLYAPATKTDIADKILSGEFGQRYSMALCMEDTISDDMVEKAEEQIYMTLKKISESRNGKYVPKIFVRVRTPEQIVPVFNKLDVFKELLTGFILPKYTYSNAARYNSYMVQINTDSKNPMYMMPILESSDLINPLSRKRILSLIYENISVVKDLVLNIRIGGNDFSNYFAVRRRYSETIYDIFPVAQIIGDIISVFSDEYVISGPVWEYFSSGNEEWLEGLKNEMRYDRLNGLVGKTVIHPKQIPVVNDMMKVTKRDFEDAKMILGWDESGIQVAKSFDGGRMNEMKTHYNWAMKIMTLADLYGVV